MPKPSKTSSGLPPAERTFGGARPGAGRKSLSPDPEADPVKLYTIKLPASKIAALKGRTHEVHEAIDQILNRPPKPKEKK